VLPEKNSRHQPADYTIKLDGNKSSFVNERSGFNKRLSMVNNDILKKLRIALKLKDTDILEILKLSGMELSAAELGALFRAPDHRNYKECGDQVLRRFLDGLIIKMRGPRDHAPVRTWENPELKKQAEAKKFSGFKDKNSKSKKF
jgi:hypothetical protein